MRPIIVMALAVGLTSWAWSPARADQPAEKAPGGVAKHADTAHAAGPGGPSGHGDAHEKPSMFAGTLDLAIWTWVVFLLLLFILSRYAWKPLMEGLRKREESIKGALDEAARAREDAQRLRADLQKELDKASEKVRDILDEARRDAQHVTEEMLSKARTEIGAERDRLRREVETARDQALQQIWHESANLAALISARAIRKHVTPEDHARLIDDALADFRTIGERGIKEVTKLI